MNDNLEALLFLLRLPCLLISRIFRLSEPPPPKPSIQTREAALKRIESNEPNPLPRIRPRTLTLTTDLHRSNDSARCSSEAVGEVVQRSIPSFFKLPLEVRQIYTEVLGGQTLHIVRKRKRLGFLRCRTLRLEDCPTGSCLGSVDGDGVWTAMACGRRWRVDRGFFGEGEDGRWLVGFAIGFQEGVCGRFPFPACFIHRSIAFSTQSVTLRNEYSYTEALPFLYAANEFHLSSLLTLFSLQRTLVPHRLAAITSLALYWHLRYPFYVSAPAVLHHPPPHDEASWEEFWRIVRVEMRGLRWVRVRIWHADLGLDGEGERRMLAPLRALAVERGLKVMILLPWKGKEEGEVAEGLIVTRGKT